MTIPKLALSVAEAAEASGYSVDALRKAIDDGDLIPSYANTKAVIRVAELERWLEALPNEPRGRIRP